MLHLPSTPTVLLLSFFICISPLLKGQLLLDSLPPSATTVSTPAETATPAFPPLVKPREVRVKDTITNKRFWLVYQSQQELMALRKAGFVILRTRPVRDPGQLPAWQVILKDICIVVIQAGVPVILRRGEQAVNSSSSGGG